MVRTELKYIVTRTVENAQQLAKKILKTVKRHSKDAYIRGYSHASTVSYIETGMPLKIIAANYRDKIYTIVLRNRTDARASELTYTMCAYATRDDQSFSKIDDDSVNFNIYKKKKNFHNPEICTNSDGIRFDFVPNFTFLTKKRKRNKVFYLVFITLWRGDEELDTQYILIKKRAEGGELEKKLKPKPKLALTPGMKVKAIDMENIEEMVQAKMGTESTEFDATGMDISSDSDDEDDTYEVMNLPPAPKRDTKRKKKKAPKNRKKKKAPKEKKKKEQIKFYEDYEHTSRRTRSQTQQPVPIPIPIPENKPVTIYNESESELLKFGNRNLRRQVESISSGKLSDSGLSGEVTGEDIFLEYREPSSWTAPDRGLINEKLIDIDLKLPMQPSFFVPYGHIPEYYDPGYCGDYMDDMIYSLETISPLEEVFNPESYQFSQSFGLEGHNIGELKFGHKKIRPIDHTFQKKRRKLNPFMLQEW